MRATNVLVEEHRVIERVLNALETAVERLEQDQPVRPEFFLSATEFIRGYADGCHHQKEEGVLFVTMSEAGIPTRGCPLGVMLAEHELGRQYTQAMTSAAEDMRAGDASAKGRAIMSSRSYVTLLRQHIFKEDNILFPMAEGVIPAGQQGPLEDRFAQVVLEEAAQGAHEKFQKLAMALEAEIAD